MPLNFIHGICPMNSVLSHLFRSHHRKNLPPIQLTFHLRCWSTLCRGQYLHRWEGCDFLGINWMQFMFLLLEVKEQVNFEEGSVHLLLPVLFYWFTFLWILGEGKPHHSAQFWNIAGEAKLFFVCIPSRLCDAANKVSPRSPFSVVRPTVLLQDIFTWPLPFILLSRFFFAALPHPNPPTVTVVRGCDFYYPNTKADSELKDIVAHSHNALSASLTLEVRRFISKDGLKTI